MLRVSQLLLSLDDDKSELERKILKKLHLQKSQLISYRIYKEDNRCLLYHQRQIQALSFPGILNLLKVPSHHQ